MDPNEQPIPSSTPDHRPQQPFFTTLQRKLIGTADHKAMQALASLQFANFFLGKFVTQRSIPKQHHHQQPKYQQTQQPAHIPANFTAKFNSNSQPVINFKVENFAHWTLPMHEE